MLLFIDKETRKIYDFVSWEDIIKRGGLRKAVNEAKLNYDNLYNQEAMDEYIGLAFTNGGSTYVKLYASLLSDIENNPQIICT